MTSKANSISPAIAVIREAKKPKGQAVFLPKNTSNQSDKGRERVPLSDGTLSSAGLLKISCRDAPILQRDHVGAIFAGLKIERLGFTSGRLEIAGWNIGSHSLTMLADGQECAVSLNRTARPEVLDAYHAGADMGGGFLLSTEFLPSRTYQLRWKFQEFNLDFHLADLKENALQSASTGVLDNISANFVISGWAVAGTQRGPCVIQARINGVSAAMGKANLMRADLMHVSRGHMHGGFSFAIPHQAITDTCPLIEVFADGHLLTNGRTTIDLRSRMSLEVLHISDGHLNARVVGWPGGDLRAHLYIDGHYASDVFFVRTKDAGKHEATASQRLPEACCDAHPHLYQLKIVSKNGRIESDVVTLAYPRYTFHLDNVDEREIAGWAFCNDDEQPLALRIDSGAVTVGELLVNMPRPDVAAQFPRVSNACGFVHKLPPSRKSRPEVFRFIDVDRNISIAEVSRFHAYDKLTALACGLATDQDCASAHAALALAPLVIGDSGLASQSTRHLPLGSQSTGNEVCVIVPIYEGLAETIECLDSVMRATNTMPVKYVVVNDCSPRPEIVDYLHYLEEHAPSNFSFIHRQKNGGFSEAVNMGIIAAGDADVILLNSDTVVQDFWVDRLFAAATSAPRIGTVTPFSNNAEICSLPYLCNAAPIQDPEQALMFDRLAQKANKGRVVDIPVAVGFCMYIKRACINEIGRFDAGLWGRGYGEEVDFCMKASAGGWRHVLAADVFVVHRGNVSFGAEKFDRIKKSSTKISELYPFYDRVIHRFLAEDPVGPLRRRINLRIIGANLQRGRILHICHGYGGGTLQYVSDLMMLHEEAGFQPLCLYIHGDGTAELRMDLSGSPLSSIFNGESVEKYFLDEFDCLREDISILQFDEVHVHSPFGLDFSFMHWLVDTHVARFTVHDYAWISPRPNLFNSQGGYCEESNDGLGDGSLQQSEIHPGLKGLVDQVGGDITRYRTEFAKILGKAKTVFAGGVDVVKRLVNHGIKADFKVAPHPAPQGSLLLEGTSVRRIYRGGPIKVAVFGGLSDIKGFWQILECAQEAKSKKIAIEFIIFGFTLDDGKFADLPNVKVLGRYEEKELKGLVHRHRPDCALFLNQGPETYSYTLSHAFRLGVWPIATDIGVPAERIRDKGFGTVIDLKSTAQDVLQTITRLMGDYHYKTASHPELEKASSFLEYASTV
jgi:GT2 family glycosyltransferase